MFVGAATDISERFLLPLLEGLPPRTSNDNALVEGKNDHVVRSWSPRRPRGRQAYDTAASASGLAYDPRWDVGGKARHPYAFPFWQPNADCDRHFTTSGGRLSGHDRLCVEVRPVCRVLLLEGRTGGEENARDCLRSEDGKSVSAG